MDQETTSQKPGVQAPQVAIQGNSTAHQITKGVILGLIVFGVIFISAIYVGLSGVSIQKEVAIQNQQNPQTPKTLPPDPATSALNSQGTSDDIADIDQDLTATDLSSLDDVNKI